MCLPLPLDDEQEDTGGHAEDHCEHGHDGGKDDVMDIHVRCLVLTSQFV